MQDYKEVLAEILIDEKTLQKRVAELGAEISRDYECCNLILICILRGGMIFLVDLMRHITVPHTMDFMAVSSYGVGARESGGSVRVTYDLQTDIRGKDVLLVEDIVDTGITIDFLLRHLSGGGPKNLKVCALIDKREQRRIAVTVDYAGIVCDRGFLVGYGLDLDERCRELEAIYEVADLPSCGGLNDNSM